MEHYVTLFDLNFAPQGLALYASMQRNIGFYTLWIICVDDSVYKLLAKLSLENVRLLQLRAFETEDLVKAKIGRTKAEYCWTLTPFAPKFVFDVDTKIERITYIDADLWFRSNPNLIHHEFSQTQKHVLITEHAYSPEYDQSETSGIYCVQFMTFSRTGGEHVRRWWEQRCIEWCFARHEDGKFGDQKYLDDWPERFSELVHVLKDKELALGPWNSTRYPYGRSIFYHFHGLRILNRSEVEIGFYKLPKCVIKNIYTPYLMDLKNAVKIIETAGIKLKPQSVKQATLKKWLRRVAKFVKNITLNGSVELMRM
jgi:hypothetical protein